MWSPLVADIAQHVQRYLQFDVVRDPAYPEYPCLNVDQTRSSLPFIHGQHGNGTTPTPPRGG